MSNVALAMDPALVKYNSMPGLEATQPSYEPDTNGDVDMMVNRHKYFRWTGRTARITFAYVVAVPALIGYLAYTTDVSALWTKWRRPY